MHRPKLRFLALSTFASTYGAAPSLILMLEYSTPGSRGTSKFSAVWNDLYLSLRVLERLLLAVLRPRREHPARIAHQWILEPHILVQREMYRRAWSAAAIKAGPHATTSSLWWRACVRMEGESCL
ncbi:hypothetical protein B0H16DRAFT_1897740 [Mycena metata]|uniref:Uncharacterized protein n=1 Tax=Mycena metata TaxID=1033252 RepID=A0AAD7MHR8_9AGAR|nr:hypothetical protein B0H16DRAFT_1897740 [Mycena metata]